MTNNQIDNYISKLEPSELLELIERASNEETLIEFVLDIEEKRLESLREPAREFLYKNHYAFLNGYVEAMSEV